MSRIGPVAMGKSFVRTMTSSIARTCTECGTLNRVTIMTSGMSPSWRIACSHCGEMLVMPPNMRRQAPCAEVIPLPVPAMRPGAALPVRRDAMLPARRGSTALAMLPVRDRIVRAAGGASTGVSFLAACGVVMAALMVDRVPEAPAPEQALAGPAAPFAGAAVVGGSALAVLESERAAADPLPRLSQPEPLVEPRLAAADAPESPVDRAASAAPWRLAAAAALGGRAEAYPDPMEGMMAVQMASLDDPAQAEAGLALSDGARREVQRRLALARHDPQGVDGVFGPATRAAIAAWQEKAGLPATGYVDERAFAVLAEQTEEEYRAWATAEKKRRSEDRQFASIQSWPTGDGRSGSCQRAGSGQIAYGQNIKCDLKGFRESFGALRQNVAQMLDGGGSPSSGRLARRGPGDA